MDVADDRGDHGERQLVELHPLAEDAAGSQTPADDAEELGCIQGRDAGQPGVARLRGDHVVAGGIDLEGAARVVHDRRDGGPGEHRVVHREEVASHLEHGRLDLDHPHPPHAGHIGEGSGGHPAPEADHEPR